ncbi:MAG: T9SS type A sorting domain-containing protein, partial [candidate division WOR-3 bacterium]
KGNKCYELWRYVEGTTVYGSLFTVSRSGVQAGFSAERSWFRVAPNPLVSGWAMVRYSLPKAGPVTVTVFDVAGRSVQRQTLVANKAGAVALDLRKLVSGVYLVRLDASDLSQTQKLVVQR